MTAMKSYEKLCRGIISCLAQSLGLTKTVSFRSVRGQNNRLYYKKDGDKLLFLKSREHPLSVVSNLNDKDVLELNPWLDGKRKALGDGYAVVFMGYGSVMKQDRSYINLYVLDSTGTVHITIDNGIVSCRYLALVGYRLDGKPVFRKPKDNSFLNKISDIVLAYADEHPALENTKVMEVFVIECDGRKIIARNQASCAAEVSLLAENSTAPVTVRITKQKTVARKTPSGYEFPEFKEPEETASPNRN